ncbi:MAG: DUF4294 domain-containing protein [Bacteroidetes bacterium]|nr:DUF4294 domain-containing protein [Bacteroidota bacterium]MBS1590503.1 DUF4294 domain-containing protein [Bacteroidota bacterium]MBS1639657.1 DUF4294 domain-containing protein [Bacteroidota bacterium]MBS1642446.1 DUF4294 domain-containing protein [Bacteroidota bacterium]MBS1671554.1 DUF4294 domain-containing protein [Bacteroidota bacterium]
MKFSVLHIIRYSFIVLLLFIFQKANAQHSVDDTVRVHAYITVEGDTIPMSYLPNVDVYATLTKKQKQYWAEWTRLRNAVYVTYPYAKTASKIMNEINVRLVNVHDKKQRRIIIRSREKELRKEFTDKLTKLSIYQGKVLMKLIYRETGNSCYEILDEYKGSFNAILYQSIAFVFGTSLKQMYEPTGKDADMEKIVRDVERMYGYRS